MKVKQVALVRVLVLAAGVAAGCGGKSLTSHWADREIEIDGDLGDWDGLLVHVEDTQGAIGILNDDRYLTLALTTTQRAQQMQVLAAGLILWIDPEGGKDRVRGIRFPVGGGAGRDLMRTLRDADGQPDPDAMEVALAEALREVEILGPEEGQTRRVNRAEVQGMEIAATLVRGVLSYEVRIPLRADDQASFALDLPEDVHTVGVGLVTPEVDRASRPQGAGPGGGPPGGGRPGGGGGGRRGSGGGPGGPPEGFERPEPLDLWAKVAMASAPPHSE